MSEKISIKKCCYRHKDTSIPQNLNVISTSEEHYAVFCGVCGAMGPVAADPEESVTLWNSREVVVISKESYDKLLEKAGEEDGSEEKTD